jgi:hypothetical protein
MTPSARIVYAGALVIGLAVGLFFGFYRATDAFQILSSFPRSLAPAALADYAYSQYTHADLEHAKAALQTDVTFLEAIQKSKPAQTQQNVLASETKIQQRDMAIAYARLALLEDQSHDDIQSQAYMTKARNWYAIVGGRDYSESEMKEWVKMLDQVAKQ